MEFRIGINLGDVVVEGEKLYGDGVNIAARLEALAEPGGICISGTVYDQIENKLALGYEYYRRANGQEHRQASPGIPSAAGAWGGGLHGAQGGGNNTPSHVLELWPVSVRPAPRRPVAGGGAPAAAAQAVGGAGLPGEARGAGRQQGGVAGGRLARDGGGRGRAGKPVWRKSARR